MATTPQERQFAIDVFTQALVDNGVPDDEATDLATESVDKAIQQAGS